MKKRIYSAHVCRAHNRPKPCASCVVASAKSKLNWQTAARRAQHSAYMAGRPFAWFDEEARAIRQLAGVCSPAEITQHINAIRENHGLPQRTYSSIINWAHVNHVQMLPNATMYSARAVQELFGLSRPTLLKWRKAGILSGRAWGRYWVYDEAELCEFVRTYPWLVDIHTMLPGAVRRVAEVVNARDPWLKPTEVAKLLHVQPSTIRKYIQRGNVPFKQRHWTYGTYLVQASSVAQLSELIQMAKQNTRLQNLGRYAVVTKTGVAA